MTRRPVGRPTRGARVETKLDQAAMAAVDFLARTEGPDRSAVIARLVAAGAAAYDLVGPDVVAIREWAEEWPTSCGVLLQPGGRRVNVWHVDPDASDGILDHLHQETLPIPIAEAAARLIATAAVVKALGFGYSEGTLGRLVIRCTPDA